MKWFDPVFRYLESRVDPFAPQETYEPPSGFFRYLWFYASQFKWIFVGVFVFGVLNALIEATIFNFVGQVVDMLADFGESGRAAGFAEFWAQYGSTLIGMALVVAVARVLVVAIGAVLEEQIVVPGFFTAMRWQSHKHVINQSVAFFQNDLSGRVAQKVFQSGNAGGDLMLAVIQTGGFIAAYATTTFAMVAVLDGWIAVTVLVWLLLFGLLARFFIPRIRRHGKTMAEAGSRTTGRLVDGYTNITTVKLYGASSAEEGFIREALVSQYEALKRFTRDLTGVRVSLSLVSNVMIVAIAWQTLLLWFDDAVTTGQVAFTLALVLRLNLLLNRLMGILNGIFRLVGSVENSMELIAQPIGLQDRPDAVLLDPGSGDIRFENVSFDYGKDGEVIRDLSMEIRQGESVGLVGFSGAGKTTLMNLLLRFFDVEKGAIKIGGTDIRDVTQDSLRAQFGLVQQETALFQRSVRENIAYGSPDATEEQIIKAAKRAHAHAFIMTLEDGKGRKGYDAHVGERGVKLSGGQRQRISIARVMLRDAPILLLDEATSALDSEVEAAIQENLFELMQGKTVIAIAHRLSTLAEMDRLLVIDQGQIVESGTHDELLAKNGIYAKLWKRQSGGFLPLHEQKQRGAS